MDLDYVSFSYVIRMSKIGLSNKQNGALSVKAYLSITVVYIYNVCVCTIYKAVYENEAALSSSYHIQVVWE